MAPASLFNREDVTAAARFPGTPTSVANNLIQYTNINDMTHISSKRTRFGISPEQAERLVFGISLTCIFLFVYTAYSKTIGHEQFLDGLKRVAGIGPYALYISWLVPAAEFIVAVLLVIPKTVKWGLYGFTGLMTVFTIYILGVLLWAKNLPCHCGGAIEKLSWAQHVWFNLAFIALAVCALWLSNPKTKLKK